MKMNYAELKHRLRILQSLTRLNISQFEALLPSFGVVWKTFESDTFEREDRQRARGAGRKAELALLANQLLSTLVYFRQYPTQEIQGYLFGLRQTLPNCGAEVP